ncbi:hypothetical protein A1O3_07876 [Capronia epimyces CBS 606.96]|uniref:Uncharacterized protein n=1 Tax=Capronia epimyces CBS 606.96 TaxID=1182542 RepID=W9XGG0_9EURO|nr:uncharacterized protein A1O3_07876 [Capronia epimyces CBS 606.96]EXJ79597.1 hypothetical protein A1O3_07876 [Capronia epimyces CBS 606.96]
MPPRGSRATRYSRNVDPEEQLDDLDPDSVGYSEDISASYTDHWVKDSQVFHEAHEDCEEETRHPGSRYSSPSTSTPSRPAPRSDPQPQRARTASSQTLSGRVSMPSPTSPAPPRKRQAIRGNPRVSRRRDGCLNTQRSRLHDAEQDGVQSPPGRALRKRTIQQTYPFKFEKYRHNLVKSIGKSVEVQTIEEAVQHEIGDTPPQSARKKARLSATASERTSTSIAKRGQSYRCRSASVEIGGSLTKLIGSSGYDPTRTTLRVWLEGFPGASTPTTLKDCDNVEKLMDFIISSWEWSFNARAFHYAIVTFPRLTADSNILIRPGMTDSFRKMVDEIENSPVWAEEGAKATCEVKITVYLQSPAGE